MNTNAKIRIVLFVFLLIWGIYLSAGYSWEMAFRSGDTFSSLISDTDLNSYYVDGTDFSPLVALFGYGAKGVLSLFDIIVGVVLMLVYALLIAVLVLIPTLLLRIFGLKNKTIMPQEYEITKKIYCGGILLSLIAGLMVTKMTGLLIVIVYSITVALVTLIYISALKKKVNGFT
ncbi:MAG: hypothetical protein K6G62_03605 [Eubacterium sp.]|nr:hypothetical protein [Eubacterium sp.]